MPDDNTPTPPEPNDTLPHLGLGRIEAPDARDKQYPMQAFLPERAVQRKTKYWANFTPALDQGAHSTCVGHAWKGWLLTAPVIQTKPDQDPTAVTIYRECLPIDEWTQNDGDGDTMAFGTSVRAGAKALQARGYLSTYAWAFDADTVIDWLCIGGPVVLGTSWHSQMSFPDAEGIIKPTGAVVGGHAYLAVGVNIKRELVRIQNSWSSSWSDRGRAWLSFADLDTLIRRQGEACTAVEQKLAR